MLNNGEPATPTCLSTAEVIFDSTDQPDEKLPQLANNCRQCPVRVRCLDGENAYRDGVVEWSVSLNPATGCAQLEAECTFGDGRSGSGEDLAQLFVGQVSDMTTSSVT